jgi:hypothetical protein
MMRLPRDGRLSSREHKTPGIGFGRPQTHHSYQQLHAKAPNRFLDSAKLWAMPLLLNAKRANELCRNA